MDDKADGNLWERYKYEVEIHRSYLDLVIKNNTLKYRGYGQRNGV